MSGSGVVTGVIVVRCGEAVFPAPGWNDFPVIVLSWWTAECRKLFSGETARCRFMDGPFEFQMRPRDDRHITIAFFHRDAPCHSILSLIHI